MPRVTWTEQMNVGVPEVDRQHVHLVDLLNGLEEGLSRRGGALRTVRGLFAELSSYTKYHFSTEANVLRSQGFDGLGAHLDAHDEFVEKLAALQPLLQREGAEAAALETGRFLRQWFVRHVLVADRLAFSAHGREPLTHPPTERPRSDLPDGPAGSRP